MSNARYNLIWVIIFTLTLPLAVLGSTWLARTSFEKVSLRGQTVTVKGYAEKPIVSDRAEWSASITVRDADRTAAYLTLEEHRKALLAYLDRRGFPEAGVDLGPINIREVYARDEEGNTTNQIESYRLTQYFSIASKDVNAITATARDAGALIANGINLDSDAPRYLYTRLDDSKLEMLERATANARERAGLLLTNSQTTLGPLRSASQGVFQITPAFSTKVTSYGTNDTTSLNKVIKAVVTVEYAIVE